MEEKKLRIKLGPAVFILTFLAVLVFCWWFLIYDHGVPASH